MYVNIYIKFGDKIRKFTLFLNEEEEYFKCLKILDKFLNFL